MVTVLFFAYLKDLVPGGKITIDLLPGSRVENLIHSLEEQYPELENKLKNAIKAVNHEFAAEDTIIPDHAEVAFFPPVSGGAGLEPIIQITTAQLSADALIRQLTSETTGAICCFAGIVRQKTTQGEFALTQELYYEAYEAMAHEKMHQIAYEIQSRWPEIEKIALIQRIGLISAGEPSVLIACASSHRDAGIFEAAQYGINRLKEIVPIWKKEISDKDERWVVGEYRPLPGE